MAINLAEKASPKVAEYFTRSSMTEGLFTAKYNFEGVNVVKIYTTDLLPLNDYDRTDADSIASRFGALTEVGDTVQTMTVSQDKSFNGSIDKGNNTQQMKIKAAARILKENTKNVFIPEVDRYRLWAMANGNGLNSGHSILSNTAQAWTKAGIVEEIMTAHALMLDKNVPLGDTVCYLSITDAIKYKLSNEILGADKLIEKCVVNGVIGELDGMQIRTVPTSYMPYVGGAYGATSGTKAKALIVKKNVCVAPVNVETYRILDEHPDIDGHAVQGRFLHDCFVIDTHRDGVCVIL